MKKLKLLFMGTAEFAVPSLRRLAGSDHIIRAVVTAPDLPRGRGQKISYTPVKDAAIQLNIPVLQPEILKDQGFIDQLKSLEADLYAVVAFRVLPKDVFTLPPYGAVNLHSSLLPKYRGAAPINWAIIRGEKETGVTTFFIKEKVDTGNIILQKRIPVGEDETAGELHDRLAEAGSEVLVETVNQIADGHVKIIQQNESLVSSAPKIFKENCKINWADTSVEIKNFIRGLSPYPCAFTVLNGESIKIYKADISDAVLNDTPAGTIISTDYNNGIGVVSGDKRILYIKEVQPASKKKMSVSEYLRGYKIEILSRFE
jgi:methionyl-tRNA formyltransferase